MGEIICTIPWCCGESDCKQQWHLSHYWYYPFDDTYSVCDSDGDHDPCDKEDVPSPEAQEEAWLDYYDYVARTGLDPVDEFILPTLAKKKRKWQARLRLWIGAHLHGLMVTGVRRRGRGPWVSASEAPAEVREYLLLHDKRNCIGGYPTFESLRADNVDIKMQNALEGWLTFEVEEPPARWSDERISAWLKRKAREAIRDRKARSSASR